MVGATGIEPVTPTMSTECSPAELRALNLFRSKQVRYTGDRGEAQERERQSVPVNIFYFIFRYLNYEAASTPRESAHRAARGACKVGGLWHAVFPFLFGKR